jgi:ABC-2 type transport system ATP-binding protein
VSAVMQAEGLGKRYRRRWALTDCTLRIPSGRVVGLVGPNGAGKSTLLNLAVGLLTPTFGRIDVLDAPPARGPAELAPGRLHGPGDPDLFRAERRRPSEDGRTAEPPAGIGSLPRTGSRSSDSIGRSGPGSCPPASLDPLARRQFLQGLMEVVAEQGVTVVLATGHLLTGPRRDPGRLPADQQIVSASHTDRQRCWSAPTSQSWTRRGRWNRSASKTWCSPT